MEYLKKYDITDNEIFKLKDRYNDGIIQFIENNREHIEEKLDYLQNEKFVLLYEIMYNNIKIFFEEISELKNKVNKMKKQHISLKSINMVLIEEELYDIIK